MVAQHCERSKRHGTVLFPMVHLMLCELNLNLKTNNNYFPHHVLSTEQIQSHLHQTTQQSS